MTKKLTVSAMLIALATVLAVVSKIIPGTWLWGGSVTLASMLPIAVAGMLLGTKWGVISALVYSVLQMIMGFYPPPVQNALYYFLVVMLDYVLAFGVIGTAGMFYRLLGKKVWAIPFSCAVVTTLRFACHFISGILIWGAYAGEGQSVYIYSLIYNGTYMLPEIVITIVSAALLAGLIKKFEMTD